MIKIGDFVHYVSLPGWKGLTKTVVQPKECGSGETLPWP